MPKNLTPNDDAAQATVRRLSANAVTVSDNAARLSDTVTALIYLNFFGTMYGQKKRQLSSSKEKTETQTPVHMAGAM